MGWLHGYWFVFWCLAIEMLNQNIGTKKKEETKTLPGVWWSHAEHMLRALFERCECFAKQGHFWTRGEGSEDGLLRKQTHMSICRRKPLLIRSPRKPMPRLLVDYRGSCRGAALKMQTQDWCFIPEIPKTTTETL